MMNSVQVAFSIVLASGKGTPNSCISPFAEINNEISIMNNTRSLNSICVHYLQCTTKKIDLFFDI